MLTGAFVFLAILGGLVLYGSMTYAQKGEDLKDQRERAKLQVDILRAERLRRDLAVVENRAILVGNQAVVADLRIETMRRELGLGTVPFRPNE